MERAETSLRIGHQEEPSQAVFQALLAESLLDELLEPAERVLIADIAKTGPRNSWVVGDILRRIGLRRGLLVEGSMYTPEARSTWWI